MTEPVLEYEPVLRKEAERQLVAKLREIAIDACSEEIKQFADCAQGKTISVAWKCREPNQIARACMNKFKENDKLRSKMRLEYVFTVLVRFINRQLTLSFR